MLSERILKWVLASIPGTKKILLVNQLNGTTSSRMYHISLQADNNTSDYVLREFNNPELLLDEPDAVIHEAENLQIVAKHGLLGPKLIAFDLFGKAAGVPLLLMSKVEGAVVLQPENMQDWVDKLAQTLIKIHRINADGFKWKYFSYSDLNDQSVYSWSKLKNSWNSAIAFIKKGQPSTRSCFIHRDYHPANALGHLGLMLGTVGLILQCYSVSK